MTADSPKTVLIFAHECAPYHRLQSTVGAQRPAQFAKYLPAAGWRAIVLCCDATRRGDATAADSSALSKSIAEQIRNADPRESMVIATPSLPFDGMLDRSWRHFLPRNGDRSAVRDALRK